VTECYLATLDLPLLAGRSFSGTELLDGAPVALVSRVLAHRLWSDGNPLGRRLRASVESGTDWLTVIGVVGETESGHQMVEFDQRPAGQLYVPYRRILSPLVSMLSRGSLDSAALSQLVRSQAHELDPNVAVYDVKTLQQAIDDVQWVARYFSQTFTAYALLALLIACVGAYGITADAVVRRARELGVHLALGAEPGRLQRTTVLHALRRSGTGVAIGLLVALPTMRLLSGMLYGVHPNDPLVFAAVAGVLLASAATAAYLPARRILRLDPNTILRAE